MKEAWQPTANITALKRRAEIVQKIRTFFAQGKVLEVETPCLSAHSITDPYLEAMHTEHTEPGAQTSSRLYLQTSPEYAMKRLLASGSGDIFQISKAFRDDEVGRFHNPEFTMLEWYRVGFNMQQLIDETASLLLALLPVDAFEQATYASLFEKHVGVDPLEADLPSLLVLCTKLGLKDYVASLHTNLQLHRNGSIDYSTSASIEQKSVQNNASQTHASDAIESPANVLLKDSILQVLFSNYIEPHIGQKTPIVVHDFPASQASLATLNSNGVTANRFEVYFKGVELANGFEELNDAPSQLARFEQDNEKRIALGLSIKKIDEHFIAALTSGLPACSGVALGIDRLIMLILKKETIEEVMSFSHRNC